MTMKLRVGCLEKRKRADRIAQGSGRRIGGGMLAMATLPMLCFPVMPASAVDISWTGDASQDWFDIANWNPAQLPGSSDTVFINIAEPGQSPVLTGAANASIIYIGRRTVAGNSEGVLSLTDGASLTADILSLGTFAPSVYTGMEATVSGSLLFEGEVELAVSSIVLGSGFATLTSGNDDTNISVMSTLQLAEGASVVNSLSNAATTVTNLLDNTGSTSAGSSYLGAAQSAQFIAGIASGYTDVAGSTAEIDVTTNLTIGKNSSYTQQALNSGSRSVSLSGTGTTGMVVTSQNSSSWNFGTASAQAGTEGNIHVESAVSLRLEDGASLNLTSVNYGDATATSTSATVAGGVSAEVGAGQPVYLGSSTAIGAGTSVNSVLDVSLGEGASMNLTAINHGDATASGINPAGTVAASASATNTFVIGYATAYGGGSLNARSTFDMERGSSINFVAENYGATTASGSGTLSESENVGSAILLGYHNNLGNSGFNSSIAMNLRDGASINGASGIIMGFGQVTAPANLAEAALSLYSGSTIETGGLYMGMGLYSDITGYSNTLHIDGVGSRFSVQEESASTAVIIFPGLELAYGTYIGMNADGEVNVSNGGLFSSESAIVLGYDDSLAVLYQTEFPIFDTTGVGVITIGGVVGSGAVGAGHVSGAILTTDGSGVINFNHTDTNYTFDASSVSGDIAVNHYAGVTRFGGSYSYTGPTTIHGGSLLVGSTLTSSAVTVSSGGVLGGTGTVGAVSNTGTIAPGAGLATGQFGTLTVAGDYSAAGNATLRLRTALGGDGAATDRLVLDGGTASGKTRVVVTNAGGTGAVTDQGIRVIQATNGTVLASDAFVLSGATCAGIFCYDLTQGDGTTVGQYDYFLTSNVSENQFQDVFAPVAQVAQQGQAQLTGGLMQNLFVARNAFSGYLTSVRSPVRVAAAAPAVMSDSTPAANAGWYWPQQRRHAFYATGSFGVGHGNDFGNWGYSGTAGVLHAVTDGFALGGGVVASRTDVDTSLGGSNRMNTVGGSLLASYEPGDEGIRLYGSLALVYLDAESDRRYTNGAGIESSRGDTDGYALGTAVRAGYALRLDRRSSVMPYTELQWLRAAMDGYTETGAGGLPATVGKQLEHRTASYLGAEYSRAVTDEAEVRLRAAWGHELHGGASVVNTSTLGYSQTVYGIAGDRDWAEGAVTGIWRVSETTTFTSELSGRAGNTQIPALNLMAGVSIAF